MMTKPNYENDVEGVPVSFQWDRVGGKDFVVIKDHKGELIVTIAKELWDHDIELRDKILERARGFYG